MHEFKCRMRIINRLLRIWSHHLDALQLDAMKWKIPCNAGLHSFAILWDLALSAFLNDEHSRISRLSFPLYKENFLLLYCAWMWNSYPSACACVMAGSHLGTPLLTYSTVVGARMLHRPITSEFISHPLTFWASGFERHCWLLFCSDSQRPVPTKHVT